jgi:hypothetical protein
MSDAKSEFLDEVRTILELVELDIAEGNVNVSDDSPHTQVVRNGFLVGIDGRDRYHLLVQVEETEAIIRRRLTAGIGLKNETFQVGGALMKVVDIVAEHRWKFAMELFAAEIMMEMKNGMISIETIKRIVDEHRALWAPPREPLGIPAQRGLIAEMEVVKKLGAAHTPNHIVSCWRGPDGGIHDLASDEWAVEVKSYSEEPPRVKINHIAQLDHNIDKRLTLVALHLVSDGDGKTLPEYIDEMIEWADHHGCRSRIEEILVSMKYDDERRNEYYSTYTVGRFVVCPIKESSPVFPAELGQYIPSSVSEISYLLALNDLDQLPDALAGTWDSMTEPTPW